MLALRRSGRPGDGGEGVFCSKRTITAETEVNLSTVKRAISALIEMGLIRDVAQRACASGHTVIYDMDVDPIAALPE